MAKYVLIAVQRMSESCFDFDRSAPVINKLAIIDGTFQYIDSFESRGWSKIVSSKELTDRKDKSVVQSD